MEASDGVYECKARGIFRKRGISPSCGDNVEISVDSDGKGIIEEILPRKSQIIRPPLANLDVLVFVSSVCEPRPNLLLLDEFIAIAEYKHILPVVVFTKIDKQDSSQLAGIYRNAGLTVCEVNNMSGEGSDEVKQFLIGKLSAFTGNTGVGKSSLMNRIFPKLDLATNEISEKLGRGKHTTRHVQLFKLDEGGERRDNTKRFSYIDDDDNAPSVSPLKSALSRFDYESDDDDLDEEPKAPEPEKKTSYGRFDYNSDDFDDDTGNDFSASSDDEY